MYDSGLCPSAGKGRSALRAICFRVAGLKDLEFRVQKISGSGCFVPLLGLGVFLVFFGGVGAFGAVAPIRFVKSNVLKIGSPVAPR